MQVGMKGPWSGREIEQFLQSSHYPLRLACVGSDGYPRVVSLWFQYAQEQLFCVSHRSSGLVTMLTANPRVGFEVAPNDPPYHGVRGQGDVTLSEAGGGAMLESLLGRYLGGAESSLAEWLLSRSDDERLITVTPRRWFSWDYRERMEGAVR